MNKRSHLAFIVVIAILAACIFTWSLITFFSQQSLSGRYHILDHDSMMFFRWYEQSLLQGKPIDIDSYQCFPYTQKIGLPPVIRSFYFYFANFLFAIFPNLSIEHAVGFLPPIALLILISILTAFTWKQTKNYALTILVLFFSFPGIFNKVTHSYLHLDHHFLVGLFIWAWIIFLANFLKSKDDFSKIGGALSVSLLYFTWLGSPMFAGFAFLMGMVYFFFDKELCLEYFEYYSTSLLICAGLMGIYFLKSGAAQISDMSRFGWFHFCSALVVGFGARFFIFSLKKKNAALWLGLGGIVCIIALLPMREPIAGGLKFLFAKDFLYKTVGELQPLMTENGQLMSFNKIFDFFGPEYLLFFLIWVYPPKSLFNRNGKVVRDFIVLFVLLTLNQVRFCRWIAGPLGLFSAVIVYQIVCLLRPVLKDKKMPKLALGLILVPIFVLSLNNKFLFLNKSNEIYKNRIDGYNWIQENTPVTSGYSDENPPEYGVLSFWDRGNEITCFARRPAVVSNTMRGMGTMAQIFSAETESQAYEKCKDKKVRYILTEPNYFSDEYMAFLKCVSQNASGPEFLFVSEEDEKKYAGAKLIDSFYHWLTFKAGMMPQAKFGTSEHFMLVWVSDAKVKGAMPAVMLYQAVEGALIVGKSKPGKKVRLALRVTIDKVVMDYSQVAVSDEVGNYSFRVCYPTKFSSGKVETDEFYTLMMTDEEGEVKIPLKISLDWIQSGKRVIIE